MADKMDRGRSRGERELNLMQNSLQISKNSSLYCSFKRKKRKAIKISFLFTKT